MYTSQIRRAGSLLAAVALAACAEPTGLKIDAEPATASLAWNQVARQMVGEQKANVFVAFRVYSTVSVAQLEALKAAEAADSRGNHPSRRAAIAAASAVALAYLFPTRATDVENILQQQLASPGWLERGNVDGARGVEVGRAAGAAVVEHVKTDGYSAPFTGQVPTGDGMWYSATTPPSAPTGATLGAARTFFLNSGSQFRPAKHPEFGSPAFVAALAEVRQFSDTRTAAQDSIAKFWGMGAGSSTPPGFWNEEAARLATRFHMNERRATHLLALLNMVAMDAIIASHEAKYQYWLIRPSQADAAITLSLPLPNFPAYPSNHATISSAMAEVLASAFPSEATRLRAAAEQAALSRVYGGIHYRFDGDAGLELGRKVAAWGIAKDKGMNGPLAVEP